MLGYHFAVIVFWYSQGGVLVNFSGLEGLGCTAISRVETLLDNRQNRLFLS